MLAMTAMAPQLAYIMNRILQPDSKCSNDTYSTRHERKPRLQDGTVTVDTDNW